MMQTQTTTQSLKVFNNKFIVKRKISSGSFGVVFLGIDKQTKEEVAIKLEKDDNDEVKSLDREVEILTQLQGVPGVPKLYWSGEEQDYNILVIQLLGKDLAVHMKNLKRFSLKTVLQLANQTIPLLERVHNKGVVHRDLKPENILMGRENELETVYLVDFGISKIFRENGGQVHIPFRENKPFLGTTRYASVAAHKGFELARKDDIESLFYVLLYFLKGQLPWQNLQVPDKDRTKAVGEMKAKMDLNELCQGIPSDFIKIFEYLRKVAFKSQPDYRYLQNTIVRIAEQNAIELDNVFDWNDTQTQRVPRHMSSFESKLSNECQFQNPQNNNKLPSAGNLQIPLQNSSKKIPLERNNSRIAQQMIWSVNEHSQPSGMLQTISNWTIRLSQNGLLAPPDPHKQRQQQQSPGWEQRKDGRHFSNSSLLGSQQGTYSSMRIKYVPSLMNVEGGSKLEGKHSQDQIKKSSSLSVVQEEKKERVDSFPTAYSPVIDENYNDDPLWQRFYKLKIQSTNVFFKQIQKFSLQKAASNQ